MERILLVDDSATILMSMGDILERAGFQVDKAHDGEQALARLRDGNKPCLIITDLNMPKMGGLKLIEQIRRLPAFRFTPILVLTTKSERAMRHQGRDAGATGWLLKPISGTQLLEVIREVVAVPRASRVAPAARVS